MLRSNAKNKRPFFFVVAAFFLFALHLAHAEQATEISDTMKAQSLPALAPDLSKDEAQIPVKLDSQKTKGNAETPITRWILIVGLIGVLATGSFFLIRKSKLAGIKRKNAPELKILTQHYLGPKKSLAIIRVAGESIVVGITDHHISHIKTLSLLDEDIPTETPTHFGPLFEADDATSAPILKKTKVAIEEDILEEKNFSLTGIQTFVSEKLKNMRSLD